MIAVGPEGFEMISSYSHCAHVQEDVGAAWGSLSYEPKCMFLYLYIYTLYMYI